MKRFLRKYCCEIIKMSDQQDSTKYVWIFPEFATLWIFPDFATLWLCGDQTQYFFADQTQCGGLVTKTRILHECLRFWPTGDKYAGLSPVGTCAGVGIINGWREHTRW